MSEKNKKAKQGKRNEKDLSPYMKNMSPEERQEYQEMLDNVEKDFPKFLKFKQESLDRIDKSIAKENKKRYKGLKHGERSIRSPKSGSMKGHFETDTHSI